jgi:serine/threonine protein kinase
MAPEQCAEGGSIGSAADVWGLGATLHHAIAGEVPFPRQKGDRDDEDPAVRFPQLDGSAQPLPDHVPAELGELVGRMLARAPEQRPGADEVAAGLEPLVSELPRRMRFSRRGLA